MVGPHVIYIGGCGQGVAEGQRGAEWECVSIVKSITFGEPLISCPIINTINGRGI